MKKLKEFIQCVDGVSCRYFFEKSRVEDTNSDVHAHIEHPY